MLKLHLQHHALMWAHGATERLNQLLMFLHQFASCQLCQRLGITFPLNHGFQHRSSGLTHDVRGNVPQFDVAALEYFLNAIDLAGHFVNQVSTIPGQLS